MVGIDYEKLGFKSGLEIHQQLDSSKLFCNCPSILRGDEPDFEVKRKLHLVAGEFGEIDVAAKHEFGKNKEFVYQGYKKSTCLVELDEEPPHEINLDALKTALTIALLLNCKIIPISQIMRKTVINGSNTSGFQRTVIIAKDGYVETSQGNISIEGIYLEEDSAREIKKEGNRIYYRLDRLGIPLVEIATRPDLKNAKQVKESALKIGEILRSCKVKRGIGTIRQDVNISIKEGNRVEIKGFQDPKIMERCIELEVLRQKEFLDEKEKNPSEVRNCLPDGRTEFLRPMPGKARMYPETDLPLLKISRELIDEIKKTLPKLKSEYREELKMHGLNEEMIKLILNENKIEEFKSLVKVYDNASFIAKLLLIFPKEISAKTGKEQSKIEEIILNVSYDILNLLNKKKIFESDVKDVLIKIVSGIKFEDAIKIEKTDLNVIEEKVLSIVNSKPGLSENAYMGLVMKEFKGKISGNEAMEVIKKLVRK